MNEAHTPIPNFKKQVAIGISIGIVVMSLATPPIFKGIMNQKLDQKVAELRQAGYQIEEVENKSSYLTTDRIFQVQLTGKEDINITSQVEVRFYNLPITDVKLGLKILKIEGLKKPTLKKVIEEQGRLELITPNFQNFTYKIFPIKTKNIYFSGLKGNLYYYNKNLKNEGSLNKFYIRDGNEIVAVTGLRFQHWITPTSYKSNLNGSFHLKINHFQFQISRFNLRNSAYKQGNLYNGEWVLTGNSISLNLNGENFYIKEGKGWINFKNLYIQPQLMEEPLKLLSIIDKMGVEMEIGANLNSLHYNKKGYGNGKFTFHLFSKPVQNLFLTALSRDLSPFKVVINYRGSTQFTQLLFKDLPLYNLFKTEGEFKTVQLLFNGEKNLFILNNSEYTPNQFYQLLSF